MIGGDQLLQILGVTLHRQRGRPDEIAKHHRELASLDDRHTCDRAQSTAAAQCRDGGKQSVPVSDGVDADILQILGGQFRQYCGVDRVVAKRLFVLLQPETVEPRRDVQARLPSRSSTLA